MLLSGKIMNDNDLKEQWKSEESFTFQGWDFSHIEGRWASGILPWDYWETVLSFLKSTDKLLDLGTGGGEFLLSLGHPFTLTSVTEAYPPNVELCKENLAPSGVTVMQTYEDDRLPFEDRSFDIVINRHESFDPAEVGRVLKKGGYFITQQVGGENEFPGFSVDDALDTLCQFQREIERNGFIQGTEHRFIIVARKI